MRASNNTAFVEAFLDRYKRLTVDLLLEYLPATEPRRHLYDLLPSYPTRPGKGLRPGLCIGTCLAFEGRIDDVIRCAVAIEMFHNAFLIHDDLEDGSEERRGEPTLHAVHGIPIAVNAGDALNVLSIGPLMENLRILGPSLTWDVFTEIQHMVRQSVEGQAMELGWVRDNDLDLTEDDYLRMTLKKTCWYTCMHPCRIGCLVARGDVHEVDRFNRFAYFMGAAFQIQDDILNLIGERERYGKEIGGDIWEGKRTLMLIYLVNSCRPYEKDRLGEFLQLPRPSRTAGDVRWVLGRMKRYGSIEIASETAHGLALAARDEFETAYAAAPEGDDKRLIRGIVDYMIERDL